MPSETTRKSNSSDPPQVATKSGLGDFLAPGLWGLSLTAGFYLLIPLLPAQPQEILTRCFCSHAIVSLQTGLFFLGLVILIRKTVGLVHEQRALKLVVVDGESLEEVESAADRAHALYSATADIPAGIRRSKLVTRIRETCEYVARRGPGAAIEDQLRYLADLAVEELVSSYALIRTLIWTLPVMGILGTVLAIGQAFNGFEPEKLDSSMTAVLTGLAGAFDPTAVGLAMSVVLVFGKLLVERNESRVLARVEQVGMCHLAPCLAIESPAIAASPLTAAEAHAATQLLERTESLVVRQTELWQEALEGLRNRWTATLEKQQTQFASLLEQGMLAGINSHSQQLDEARAEFLKGFRAVGMELTRVTAGLQQMGEEHQARFHKQVTEVWQALSAQLGELQQQGALLQSVAGQEQELVRLQTTLTHNLQSVRAMEAFEESIHSLNAAVHLLTMRTKSHAA